MKNKRTSEINSLDWTVFNFLENLLAFCVMPERNAPPENGLHFRISPRETDQSLCLLFETDRVNDSLFQNGIRKPDYMAFYAKANGDFCLCTIVEMKGGKNIKDGIEQIKILQDKLKKEIKAHLPNKFKVKYQAILLHSPNSQTPYELIKRESSDEFIIRPVQVTQKAELFDFVCQKFTFTEPKINPQEQIRSCRKDLFIEGVLSQNALPNRKVDKFCKAKKHIANSKDGVYINYSLSNNDYAALTIDNSGITIAVKEDEKVFAEQIQNDLKKVGLNPTQHYSIEGID